MFTYQGTVVDSYGIEHTDPVFEIEYFHHQSNSGVHGEYNDKTGTHNSDSFQDMSVNFNVIFWTSAAAKADGANPLMFVHKTQRSNNSYHFTPDSTLTSQAAILAACKAHFLDVVLPEFVVEAED